MAEFTLSADETRVIQALDNIEKKLTAVGVKADETGQKIGQGISASEADTKRAAASLAEYTAAQEKLKAGAQDRIAQNAVQVAAAEGFVATRPYTLAGALGCEPLPFLQLFA